jgi:pimeloyl-ACP methyl ester carboxylesterase
MAIVAPMLRSLAGGTLFGESWAGDGYPLVVALHGWGRTHADFARVLGPSSAEVGPSAVAPDLPGFGATPHPPEVWGSPQYAQAVAAMLRAMADRSPAQGVVVLGHSFGGRVALALAEADPELVRGLVLTGVPLLRRPGARRRPPARYRVVRALNRVGLVGESRMEAARMRYGSDDYRRAEGVMRGVLVRLLSEDYEPVLRSLRCPVELVWGDDDTEVPLSVAEAAQTLIPGASLIVLPGAGHLTPLTVPGELRRSVERLVSGL